MHPAYIQLVAKCSSPSICATRATGWPVSLHVHILGHRGKTWSLKCQRKAALLVSELAQLLELGPGLFSNLWDSTTEQRLKGAACNFQLYCCPVLHDWKSLMPGLWIFCNLRQHLMQIFVVVWIISFLEPLSYYRLLKAIECQIKK